jgi:hypothetical protein
MKTRTMTPAPETTLINSSSLSPNIPFKKNAADGLPFSFSSVPVFMPAPGSPF